MVYAANLGYPRIGFKRELKSALEKYWSGQMTEEQLIGVGASLKEGSWLFQSKNDLDFIPSNDFSFYDHVLDTIAMVGAVPKRFGWTGGALDLKTYFLMARGIAPVAGQNGARTEAQAMEMTKWFNTNYHFIVPELDEIDEFVLSSSKCIDEFRQAKKLGLITRPVLLGPITFLCLAKGMLRQERSKRLDSLLEIYCQILATLKGEGATWVQIDEPCLATDLDDSLLLDFDRAYRKLSGEGLSIMLTSYFGPMARNLESALKLPVQGIHLDLVNGFEDLAPTLSSIPSNMFLSAGVVDGHNVWRTNLSATFDLLENIGERIGPERLIVAPSCSLLHVPLDAEAENKMDPEVRQWIAFAQQKVQEISTLADALSLGRKSVASVIDENSQVIERAKSSRLRNAESVQQRVNSITEDTYRRKKIFNERRKLHQQRFNLPLFPTTTIGSFPQTTEIRTARQKLRSGKLTAAEYRAAMETEIKKSVELQEKIGLDVLVHGEPERTDMVEYFAELLDGVAVTQHGWVQSYGSRCVRPPIIFGSVSRPSPMTVDWTDFAQKQTSKPMKGMLTGPVTILQWSFVRNDQERSRTCLEIALAIRDEVADLENAGIGIIQIDEPAIREGLPLRRDEWPAYLQWSVDCFRASSAGARSDTQIHTHMCYSEFGDMVESIARMDADVISIEASRSKMELLNDLKHIEYPNEIGPGIYDIHSPRIPTRDEMVDLLLKALLVIEEDKLWVNPDCGLKTRGWEQVIPALTAMVEAAIEVRNLTRSKSEGLPIPQTFLEYAD